jgi:HEAT repeat protein
MEKVMRGSVDTAVDVRSACAAGLVRMNHPAAMEELAALLADPEPAARRAAARTIAYADDRRAGAPLLRLKALSGDPEASVVAECLAGLVALSAEGAVPFVARFLEGPRDAVVEEAAALALGESRRSEALEPLRAWYERRASRSEELRAPALAAIAMLRDAAAFDYLIDVVASGPGRAAADALRALAPFRADAALARRAREAAAGRDDRAIDAALLARFEA